MNNNYRFAKLLLRIGAMMYLILLQCAGGFESDSPNAPEIEDAVFGSDSGG